MLKNMLNATDTSILTHYVASNEVELAQELQDKLSPQGRDVYAALTGRESTKVGMRYATFFRSAFADAKSGPMASLLSTGELQKKLANSVPTC